MRKVNLFLVSLATLAALSVGFSSCSINDYPFDNDNGNSSNALVGKWGLYDDNRTTVSGYWTFHSDGTVLIDDRRDIFDGQMVKYSYNSQTKKLTLVGGLVVYLLDWKSSKEFYIQSIETTFKKV